MSEFKYFRVVLPNGVDTATVNEGFIDDKEAEEFSTLPTTDNFSEDKERANMRWEEIIKMIQETGAETVQDIDVTTSDRDDGDVAPTQIDFTVKYRADRIVYMYDLVTDPTGKTVYGPATSLQIAAQPGYTYTNATEAAVIERAIATALAQDTFTDLREVYDPTTTAGGAIAFPQQFRTIQCTQLGTGASHAARMANIEGVGGFTVTQLNV